MIVISDTSPITNLALIGQLILLQQLYGSIIIPQAVAHEIAAVTPRLSDSRDILQLELNVRHVELLGALIDAKHQGLLPAVRPVLDDLIVKAGFWISRELYDRVLQAAGE